MLLRPLMMSLLFPLFPLFALFALFAACEPTPDVVDVPTARAPTPPAVVDVDPLVPLVRAALAADCAADALEPFRQQEPADVAAAIRAVAMSPDDPLPEGVSRGIVLAAGFHHPDTERARPTYDVLVPGDAAADLDGLPVLFVTGYPLDPPSSTDLEALAWYTPEPTIVVALDFWSRYHELGDVVTCQDSVPGCEDQIEDFQRAVRLALRDVGLRASADLSRVWMTGASFNAAATWDAGVFSDDAFAAIVPVSVYWAPDLDVEALRNLIHVPVRVVHGALDDNTPVEPVRVRVGQLERLGVDVVYDEHPNDGHSTMFWRELPMLAEWAMSQRRELTPDHVHAAVYHPFEGTTSRWLSIRSWPRPFLETRDSSHNAPEVLVDASWDHRGIILDGYNVDRVELFWREGPSGTAATGSRGDEVNVAMNGRSLGTVELVADPSAAVRAFCQTGDASRDWAGSVVVDIDQEDLDADRQLCTPAFDCDPAEPFFADCCFVHEAPLDTGDFCDAAAARRLRSVAVGTWKTQGIEIGPSCAVCRFDDDGQPSAISTSCSTQQCTTGQCWLQARERNPSLP